jgi:hypothetical protein
VKGRYTIEMQLHAARLCLDCQEVHSASHCPNCASESFAALSRWIPVQERRARSRSTQESESAETYRRLLASNDTKPASRWPKRLALVVAVGVGGWLWRRPPHGAQK